jgi:hypothetical protein
MSRRSYYRDSKDSEDQNEATLLLRLVSEDRAESSTAGEPKMEHHLAVLMLMRSRWDVAMSWVQAMTVAAGLDEVLTDIPRGLGADQDERPSSTSLINYTPSEIPPRASWRLRGRC